MAAKPMAPKSRMRPYAIARPCNGNIRPDAVAKQPKHGGRCLAGAENHQHHSPSRNTAPRANTWAAQIRAAWQSSLDGILEAGRLLIAAKAALAHGEFLAMVESDLPFGPRTAQRLMAIADDPRLTNATHVSLLPPNWGTLYELTKLDDAVKAFVADRSERRNLTKAQQARRATSAF
jgi:hypothetical protein